ncbi:hypothetical protein N9R39_03875 [Amylibacter sp.]|nr:hypothetical protein [Amylibacter sp.]
MNWIKYLLSSLILITTTLFLVFLGDLIAKIHLGLGEPIVYDSHALWGYSPRENRRYIRFNSDVVTINNVGARGLEEWRKDGANILFLGDSVTYGGSYIDDSQTFSSLTCANIPNWSCHNAGVNAYGILNMVARSRYDLRINEAPFRVFTFISGDFDRGLQNADTAHFILRDAPNYLNGLWEVMNFVASRVNPKQWFGKQSDIQDAETLREAQMVNRQFALDIFMNELERLKSIGYSFLIVHSPDVDEVEDQNLINSNFVLSTLSSTFPENYLSLIDPIRLHFENDKNLIYKDSVHFEELGHRIASESITPFILNSINNE